MKSFKEGIKEKFENIADQTQDLFETGYKIAILEGTEQITKVVSTTIVISLLLLLLNFLILFLGLGVAWWIGDLMNDVKIGFFIVGGFYLLLIILIVVLGKKLVIPFFRNMIIKKIYE